MDNYQRFEVVEVEELKEKKRVPLSGERESTSNEKFGSYSSARNEKSGRKEGSV